MKTTTQENQKTDGNEMNDAQEIPCKHLGPFVIIDDGKNGKRWLTVCDTGEGDLSMLTGKAIKYDKHDLIWLSSWKGRSPAPEQFKTIQDFDAELAKLPVWDETRWACTWFDFEGGGLIDLKKGIANSKSKEARAKSKQLREHFEAEARLKNEVRIALN